MKKPTPSVSYFVYCRFLNSSLADSTFILTLGNITKPLEV